MTAACLLLLVLAADPGNVRVDVGSKAFTESVILGEIIAQLGRHAGLDVSHHQQLGGTRLVWDALLKGDIDAYPDYTGTISQEIFIDPTLQDKESIRAALAKQGIAMTHSLGFNNTYAIGMRADVAKRLGIDSISDLKHYPELRFGFSNEFLDRSDGWPGLQRRYGLPQQHVRGLDHTLAYHALVGDDIQATDIYGTDAHIKTFGLRVLKDDLEYFPNYDAVILYRAELAQRTPAMVAAIERLEGKINEEVMSELNRQVDVEQHSEQRVAANFLAEGLSVGEMIPEPSRAEVWEVFARRLLHYTGQHLLLVAVSLASAIAVAVPLGVLCAKRTTLGQLILSAAEIIQTIPGLALLILLLGPVRFLGLPGLGPATAIAALFLYSLLPIIRNTYTGIHDIPNSIRESATALGLTGTAQLLRIELPIASRLILAGVKTTAVINVGYATLGGLIGAGGYGELIMQGLRRNSEATMLEGAIPAAVLALGVKWMFDLSERVLVPRGLRMKPDH